MLLCVKGFESDFSIVEVAIAIEKTVNQNELILWRCKAVVQNYM